MGSEWACSPYKLQISGLFTCFCIVLSVRLYLSWHITRLGLHSGPRLRGNLSIWPSIATFSAGVNLGVASGDLAFWHGCQLCSLPRLLQLFWELETRKVVVKMFGPMYHTCAVMAFKLLRTTCKWLLLTFSLPCLSAPTKWLLSWCCCCCFFNCLML